MTSQSVLDFHCSFSSLPLSCLLQVNLLMGPEHAVGYESFPTDDAVIWPFSRVHLPVQLQAVELRELPATDAAAVHLFL